MAYTARVLIQHKPGVLDPQGQAVRKRLNDTGHAAVTEVEVGRLIYLKIDADTDERAREEAEEICRRVLVNPVTERYDIQIQRDPEV